MPRNLKNLSVFWKEDVNNSFSSAYDYSFIHLNASEFLKQCWQPPDLPNFLSVLIICSCLKKKYLFSALVTADLRRNYVETSKMEVSSCTKQSLAPWLDWKKNPRFHDKHGDIYFLLHQGIHSWIRELCVWIGEQYICHHHLNRLHLSLLSALWRCGWAATELGAREVCHRRTHKTELDHYVSFSNPRCSACV